MKKELEKIGTGRAIKTTGNHPYLTKNGWIKVAELSEGDYIAVPIENHSISTSNKSLISPVEKISTTDCFLNLFSLDQIAQSEDSANAKYGISLGCFGNNFKALDSNFTNSVLGTTFSISDKRVKEIINSKLPISQNLQIFCLREYNSSSAKSGTISLASLRYTDSSNFLVNESGLKKENSMLASTTINLIYCAPNYEDISYLLARLPLYSSTSFENLSSESLLFFSILSTTLNKSNIFNFSSTALLNNAFVAGFSSSSPIISLNLSGTSIFNLAILISQSKDSKNNYLNLLVESDIFFDKIVAIKTHEPQQVYDLAIERTHNFIANNIIAHNTYFGAQSFTNIDASGNISIKMQEPTGVSVALTNVTASTLTYATHYYKVINKKFQLNNPNFKTYDQFKEEIKSYWRPR